MGRLGYTIMEAAVFGSVYAQREKKKIWGAYAFNAPNGLLTSEGP